ncbi:MAG: hypothetical protein JJU37_05315 [Balneolaceae bacterium]|nr:hypothetical protein [Balneolaceae bacterium]
MSRKTVRTLFIALLIYLPLQYAVVGIVGYYDAEPWPAFVFPGFKSVYVYDDGFEITRTVFDVETVHRQRSHDMSPQVLFPEIPLSQIPGFVRTHFSDDESVQNISEDGKAWLRSNAADIAGFTPNAMHIIELTEYYRQTGDGAVLDMAIETGRITILF